MHNNIFSAALVITALALLPVACQKAGSQAHGGQHLALVSKSFRNGQLSTQYFYGDDHTIDSIHYYDRNGGITRRDEIFLNREGKAVKIITKYGHTTNVHVQENTYKEGSKKYDETGQLESMFSSSGKCVYDAGGRLSEYILLNESGSIKATYTYEYLKL